MNSSLPKEVESHLCILIEDILGEDIEDLYDLLRLTDMKNLKIACSYAKSNVDWISCKILELNCVLLINNSNTKLSF